MSPVITSARAVGGSLTKRRILIVSYLFPPMGGIGVQRALSLAKYLPQCGFEVHVLKATNAGGPVYDPALVRQIPPEVKVHTAFTPEVPFALRQRLWKGLRGTNEAAKPTGSNNAQFSWKHVLTRTIKRILCPEPEIVWVPFALRKARQIVKRYKIDSLLVTVPPFSALLVGTALKREMPSLQLISDFRDEWLSFYLKDFDYQNNEHTRRRAEDIERETIERSDLVVAVNHSSRNEIRKRYPSQKDAKFVVVPNGYDPEVFTGFKSRAHGSGRVIVTHVGTVYKTASPRFYLDALDELPDAIRERVETRFIGRISEDERVRLESRKSPVKVLGFMPQDQALKYMEETDYLLLNMTNEISVPGKLFEYMAAGKPILAVTPSGSEADQILQETASGVSAPPGDQDSIKRMIAHACKAWENGESLEATGNGDVVRRYERPRLVEEYARIMRES